MCVKYFVIWQPAIVPRESEKAGHPTLVYNFGKIMLTDFQNSFTVGLGSKRVIKWSLKISPHLKCVATLPYEK